jgi:hypothetical protein
MSTVNVIVHGITGPVIPNADISLCTCLSKSTAPISRSDMKISMRSLNSLPQRFNVSGLKFLLNAGKGSRRKWKI